MQDVTQVQVVALFLAKDWAELSRHYARLFPGWDMERYYQVRAYLLCDLLEANAGKG